METSKLRPTPLHGEESRLRQTLGLCAAAASVRRSVRIPTGPRYKFKIYDTVGFIYTIKARSSGRLLRELCLPAFFCAVFLIFFVEPGFQRSEILEHRGGVHLLLAGECFEGFGPRTALCHFAHPRKFGARFFVVVNRAAIERTGVAGRLA